MNFKLRKHIHNIENFIIGVVFTIRWVLRLRKSTQGCFEPDYDRSISFFDDFCSSHLDLTRWNNGDGMLKLNRNVASLCETDKNLKIHDSIAKFYVKELKGVYLNWDGPFEYNYTHTAISTDGKFEQIYGRWEACIKVANNKRLWPAFWLLSTPWVDNRRSQDNKYSILPEIDIIEHFGGEHRKYKNMQFTYHFGKSYEKGEHFQLPTSIAFIDFSKGFYVYSIEWTAKGIKWYVNGVLAKILRFSMIEDIADVANKPAFIILNDVVNSSFGDKYKHKYSLPDGMEVDWVRVYKPK